MTLTSRTMSIKKAVEEKIKAKVEFSDLEVTTSSPFSLELTKVRMSNNRYLGKLDIDEPAFTEQNMSCAVYESKSKIKVFSHSKKHYSITVFDK